MLIQPWLADIHSKVECTYQLAILCTQIWRDSKLMILPSSCHQTHSLGLLPPEWVLWHQNLLKFQLSVISLQPISLVNPTHVLNLNATPCSRDSRNAGRTMQLKTQKSNALITFKVSKESQLPNTEELLDEKYKTKITWWTLFKQIRKI